MSVAQRLLMGYGGLTASYPLDPYAADLWGAYGLQRLLASYTGALIRVRDSTTTTETDIGYDPVTGLLDTAALTAAVGSNSATVSKWYDQSGGAKHLAQTTAGNQPLIVNAGSYLGIARFDGANDYLLSPNSGTPSAFTVFLRVTNNSAATVKVWLEQNSASPGDAAIMYYAAATTVEVNFSQAGNTIARAAQFAANGTGQVLAPRFTRQQPVLTDSIALYSAGVSLTPGVSSNTGVSIGGFVAAPWCVGSRLGSLAAQIDITNLVIYEASKSNADMTAISGVIP